MTDLIADLAEVVSIVESLTMPHHTCDDAWFSCPKSGECGDEYAGDECNCGADAHNSKVSAVAERINATLTRIPTDDADIRAAHHDLVIRLGEVTTELEKARKDADSWRSFIASVGAEQIVAASKKFGDAEGVLLDAERYRWLRVSACDIAWNEWCSYSPGYSEGGPEELDTAIDAAMRDSAREDPNGGPNEADD